MAANERGYLPVCLRRQVAIIAAEGRDVIDLLHRLSTQDLRPLTHALAALPSNGDPAHRALPQAVAMLFTTHQGRLVARVEAVAVLGQLLLLTDPTSAVELIEWLDRYTIAEDARFVLRDRRLDTICLLAAWPKPLSAELLGRPEAAVTEQQMLAALAPGEVAFRPMLRGYGPAVALLPAAGAKGPTLASRLGLTEAALPQAEALARLLIGEPAFGLDYRAQAAPLEWRLQADTVNWRKGCFVGQEVLSRLDSYDKVARLAMGVEMSVSVTDALAANADCKVVRDGVVVGRLTSHIVLAEPRPQGLPAAVGLALVRREAAKAGPVALVFAHEPDNSHAASLVDRPYWSSDESTGETASA